MHIVIELKSLRAIEKIKATAHQTANFTLLTLFTAVENYAYLRLKFKKTFFCFKTLDFAAKPAEKTGILGSSLLI